MEEIVESIAQEHSVEILEWSESEGTFAFETASETVHSAMRLKTALEKSTELEHLELEANRPRARNNQIEFEFLLTPRNAAERFVEMIRPMFEESPESKSVEFEWKKKEGNHDTYLSIFGHAAIHDKDGSELPSHRIIIAAEIQPSGDITASVYCLDESASKRFSEGDHRDLIGAPVAFRLDSLQKFIWSFFDAGQETWRPTLEPGTDLPEKIRLVVAERGASQPVTFVSSLAEPE